MCTVLEGGVFSIVVVYSDAVALNSELLPSDSCDLTIVLDGIRLIVT